jgi:hypothetical protein
VRRGGVLKHALSNITMQRSANRSVRMTLLCRSRPLMVALDIGVAVPREPCRRRACEAAGSSQSIAALRRCAYDSSRTLKARQ